MKVQVVNAILSHLSDAQHLMKAGYTDESNTHINFVKLVVLAYDDTTEYVESETLDKIWEQAKTFR